MNPCQENHYRLLVELDKRMIPSRPARVAKLICEFSVLAGFEYACFPQQEHIALLLGLDKADVSRALVWLKSKAARIVDEPMAGLYALQPPSLWTVPYRVAESTAIKEISVWLQTCPVHQELRDSVHKEVLDKAGVLSGEVRKLYLTDVAVSGAAVAPGAKTATEIELTSGALEAPGAKADSIAPSSSALRPAGFDVGHYLRLCRDGPASPAAADYLAQFPDRQALYEAGRVGRPVVDSTTALANGGSTVGLSPTAPRPGGAPVGDSPTAQMSPVGESPTENPHKSASVGESPTAQMSPVGESPTENPHKSASVGESPTGDVSTVVEKPTGNADDAWPVGESPTGHVAHYARARTRGGERSSPVLALGFPLIKPLLLQKASGASDARAREATQPSLEAKPRSPEAQKPLEIEEAENRRSPEQRAVEAWERIVACDTACVLVRSQAKRDFWVAVCERSPREVIRYISLMQANGWRDRYRRQIGSPVDYMEARAKEYEW